LTNLPEALITFHTNRFTCGVARFNYSLAEHLGIPVVDFKSWLRTFKVDAKYLISVKPSEFDSENLHLLLSQLNQLKSPQWAFFHEFNDTEVEIRIAKISEKVVAVDRIIGKKISSYSNLVESGFAPGMSVGRQIETSDLSLLALGMSHKFNQHGYGVLNQIVERDEREFSLKVSVAVHEGHNIGESFVQIPELIRSVWTSDFFFLGFLSDAAISHEIQKCDSVVVLPLQGARESNSSILGAMAHGASVVTILDEESPDWFEHGVNILDVMQLTNFPSNSQLLEIKHNAKITSMRYGFKELGSLFLK
jgi:hypothetical protein